MQTPVNTKFARSNQWDELPATFTPASLMAADCQTAVFQPSPALNHLPRGLLPQVARAHHSSNDCQASPALAGLLAQRNNMLFSYNPSNRIIYPGGISSWACMAKQFLPILIN